MNPQNALFATCMTLLSSVACATCLMLVYLLNKKDEVINDLLNRLAAKNLMEYHRVNVAQRAPRNLAPRPAPDDEAMAQMELTQLLQGQRELQDEIHMKTEAVTRHAGKAGVQ
jgi:hypothetical protein